MPEKVIKVMVVMPHPDDAEFGCAGTVARWVREGREIIYVVCTNGDKGSSDPDMTSPRLAEIRRKEQLAAANVLGVKEVFFLDYPDGGLEDTPEFRERLVKIIRTFRPDVVMTNDPYRKYMSHRDHRVTGTVTLDAVYPYCRDRLFYPQHEAEGLKPHYVKEIFIWGAEDADTFLDISETFDLKIAALSCHASQLAGRIEMLKPRMKERAEKMGQAHGVPMAESFHRIVLPG